MQDFMLQVQARLQLCCLLSRLTVVLLGDGKTDDTVALQSLFQYAAENNLLLYIPGNRPLLPLIRFELTGKQPAST